MCMHLETGAKIVVPNAFSPDGNSWNDGFGAHGNAMEVFYMCIYNRWGQCVFESNDITKAWDGRFKGADQETGIYVYQIQYQLVGTNETKLIRGNLTLIR